MLEAEMDKIIQEINICPENDVLYLINRLSANAGFFVQRKKLVYVSRNTDDLAFNSLNSEYLSVATGVFISSVVNCQQFSNDYYNIIVFQGKNSEDALLKVFIRICWLHSLQASEMGFWEFFYSLLNLFQPAQGQKYKNLIGLWGELYFLREVSLKCGSDISLFWHLRGTYSKYDFTCNRGYCQIKFATLDSANHVTLPVCRVI